MYSIRKFLKLFLCNIIFILKIHESFIINNKNKSHFKAHNPRFPSLTARFVFAADVILIVQLLQQFKEEGEADLSVAVRLVAVGNLSDLDVACDSDKHVRSSLADFPPAVSGLM